MQSYILEYAKVYFILKIRREEISSWILNMESWKFMGITK